MGAPVLCVIGGSGLDSLSGFQDDGGGATTAYGEASAPIQVGEIAGRRVAFLPRHGVDHHIPPHAINYRANIELIRSHGIERVLAVAAVGSISPVWHGGELIVPDQLIDYTWGRQHCFAAERLDADSHYDFTEPFSADLSQLVLSSAVACGVEAHDGGTYGATQGPRLETAAEIERMARDGCDLVGMTGMPEAGLAREAGLCYAMLAVVANPAAGRADSRSLTMAAIHARLVSGMADVQSLLPTLVSALG